MQLFKDLKIEIKMFKTQAVKHKESGDLGYHRRVETASLLTSVSSDCSLKSFAKEYNTASIWRRSAEEDLHCLAITGWCSSEDLLQTVGWMRWYSRSEEYPLEED